MRSRLYILIILMIVLAGGVWYFTSDSNQNEKVTERDFAVKDRSEIHKVILTKRQGRSLELEKENGKWWVNGQKEARKNAIDNLLNGLTRVQINSLPQYSKYERLEKDFVRFSIKVEIFNEQDENIRTYYIGPDSNDGEGTYYLMEGGQRFYLMSMPYSVGTMRAIFDLKESDWWKHRVMDYKTSNIQVVKMHYPRQPQASFVLRQEGDEIRVDPLMEDVPKITRPFLKARAKEYLNEFKRKGILGYSNDYEGRDSILQIQPFAELKIITTEPDTSGYIFIPLTDDNLKGPNSTTTQESFFNFSYWLYDPESMDLMTAQHLQYKPVFRGYDYFFAN